MRLYRNIINLLVTVSVIVIDHANVGVNTSQCEYHGPHVGLSIGGAFIIGQKSLEFKSDSRFSYFAILS